MISADAKISWTAGDNVGVTTVDLCVSSENGQTFEDIATGLADTGTYTWTVTGPGTDTGPDPVHTAVIRVQARDARGNVGTDDSDQPFASFDRSTEALVSLFP